MQSSLSSKSTYEDYLIKLKNVEVYDVDSIELTYTLNCYMHTIAEDAILTANATKLLIQKSRASHDCDLMICTKLAKWLHVDVFLVWICVSQTIDMIKTIFEMLGIPELEVADDSINHHQSCALSVLLSIDQADKMVRIATNSQGPTRTARDHLYNFSPQQKRNRIVGVATGSPGSPSMTCVPQYNFSPQDKTD